MSRFSEIPTLSLPKRRDPYSYDVLTGSPLSKLREIMNLQDFSGGRDPSPASFAIPKELQLSVVAGSGFQKKLIANR